MFRTPEHCPNWGCVCQDQVPGAMVPAPDNECSTYITCKPDGTGIKTLCPIAGTGFNPGTRKCEALAAPLAQDGNACNFMSNSANPALGEAVRACVRVLAGASAECALQLAGAAGHWFWLEKPFSCRRMSCCHKPC